jgi:hypothetical protein
LLEKLLAIQEVSIHMMWRKALFQLTLFLPHRPTPSGLDGGIDFNSSDRKTAICKAALALIEKEAR